MRGSSGCLGPMFVYVTTGQFVPKKHPLRTLKPLVDTALSKLDSEFAALYASTGRLSIPPEYLLRGLVLQFLYSIRSFPLLMDHIQSDMAFRWFIGLSIEDKVWDQSVFSYNQDRLIKADIGRRFLEEITKQAAKKRLLSNEHFSVEHLTGAVVTRVHDPGTHIEITSVSGSSAMTDMFLDERRRNRADRHTQSLPQI